MYNEQIFVCGFANTRENFQRLFDKVLGAALNDRYSRPSKTNSSDLTKSIFQLTDHEKITFEGKEQNGQRIKELFITSIFIKKFLNHPEFQYITISIPPNEESYDICVSFSSCPPSSVEGKNRGKIIDKNQINLYLQIKEHFDYSLKRNNYDLEYIKKKTQNREEIFLFFNRDSIESSLEDTEKIEKYLSENENIAILSMVGSIKNEKDKELLPPNKFNFLLRINSQKIGLPFDIPSFLKSIPPEKNSQAIS